ncbi:hypothetical protein EBZ39_08295 [bacterium]|nr:hypothetical protein [bacterium]
MPDRDSNGVDILDRFLAFKYRFMQFSVTEDVFNQVVDYIKELRKERDEARREVCEWVEMDGATTAKEEAELRGWDCFKNAPVVKTLKAVVVAKGKAVPPKFDLEETDK